MKTKTGCWILFVAGAITAVLLAVNAGMGQSQENGLVDGTASFLPSVLRGWAPTATRTPTATSLPAGRLLISEVYYDPLENDMQEWIELINAGNAVYDAGLHLLGDEETPGGGEGLFNLPAGLRLEPGQAIVVARSALAFRTLYGMSPDFEFTDSDPNVPSLTRNTTWSAGNVELDNSGDEVLVMDAAGTLVDGVSWGNANTLLNPPVNRAPKGVSLARCPSWRDTDSAEDWCQAIPAPGLVDLSTATPTPTRTRFPWPSATPTSPPPATATPTLSGPLTLLLSEVHYAPTGVDEPDGEWIELYNPNSFTVPLADVGLGDEETAGGGEGLARFPEAASISPGDVLVIANQAAAFRFVYGFNPDFELYDSDPAVPNLLPDRIWGQGSINLSNPGDELLLIAADDHLLDTLSWGTSIWAFYPSVPLAPAGASLERYPAWQDSDTAADWRAQSHPSPGDIIPPTATPTASLTPSATSTVSADGTPVSSATASVTASPTLTPEPVLVFNEIHAAPDQLFGDANGDGEVSLIDDQFVEIVNASTFVVDLSGWQIWNGNMQVEHSFPDGSLLASGCAVVVFGGGMPVGDFGNSLVQTASSGFLTLHDRGDTLWLISADGMQTVQFSYGNEANQGQSIVRVPDVFGPEPLVPHSSVPDAGGTLFSPGTRLDGSLFCAPAQ